MSTQIGNTGGSSASGLAHVAGARWRTTPVAVAASLGGLLLAFETYVLISWLAGPNSTTVPYGPSEPPTWMKVSMNIGQVVMTLLMMATFYWYLIRPWRRDRQVTFKGLMCVAILLTSVYDPLMNYASNWMTYNAYFVNFGLPVRSVPGWQSFGEPGAMQGWPIFFIPPTYVVMFMALVELCTWLMRLTRARWAGAPDIVLAGIAFLTLLFFDVVIEGMIFARIGWYSETGWSINEGTYYQMPWRNVFWVGLMWTALACLTFFRNDRGQTYVERGLERLRGGGKALIIHFLAVYAAVQIILVGVYEVPVIVTTVVRVAPWPQEMQDKTYFNSHICGYDTPRTCPS